MRWQQLFADLQAQFEAEEEALERAESASRTRAEVGAVELADRLRGALGLPLTLGCGGAGTVTGVLAEVGPDWVLVEDDGARQCLVASSAVQVGRRDWAGGRRPLSRPGRCAGDWTYGGRCAVWLATGAPSRSCWTTGACWAGRWIGSVPTTWSSPSTPRDLPRRAEVVQGVRAVVIGGIAVVADGDRRARTDRPIRAERAACYSAASGELPAASAGTVPARASAYFCWMNRSSSSTSTRHCPRPPIWMAISSLRRTSA